MAGLKLEIIQDPPFFSLEEEGFLNLLRTADCLERIFHRKTRTWGLTSTQYNVLRILRGALPHGLTCAAIGSRMITAEPDITRLLARLKVLELIEQERDQQDRRIVWTRITHKGLELLQSMEPTIQKLPVELLGHLDKDELQTLIRLLELARRSSANPQTEASCPSAS
ncbi:MarR family winged helix-turn-helix transcriptional regulator [Telmatobacter bradus]|uniref:MarR family winged helix-turn-helix transcriptional regulator n=1 Tax=Telmatobacter bradus TaxID=474953 RepID=UPI003B433661